MSSTLGRLVLAWGATTASFWFSSWSRIRLVTKLFVFAFSRKQTKLFLKFCYKKKAKLAINIWNKVTILWKYFNDSRFWQNFAEIFTKTYIFAGIFAKNICYPKSFRKICVRQEQIREVYWQNLLVICRENRKSLMIFANMKIIIWFRKK